MPHAALAGRQLRQRLPLDRRRRPAATQRPPQVELAWHAEESNRFGTDEFIDYCRVLGHRAVHLRQHGHRHHGRGAGLGRVLQRHRQHHWANLRRENGHPEPYNVSYWGLGNEMYGGWQIGALHGRRLRQEGARVRQGHEADRPVHRAGQLRPERLGRLGPRRDRGAGRDRRLPQHPHLHRQRRLLPQRLRAAPGRARDADLRGADRAGALRAADRPPDRHRLRRVERLVPRRAAARTARAGSRSSTTSPTRWRSPPT